jgi:signal transduction histidine kinase
VDPAALLEAQVKALYRDWRDQVDVQLVVDQGVRMIHVDPEQIGRAVRELLRNAVESPGCRHIEVRVQIDPLDDRLQIQVADDGEGLSQHALAHAFDPFFSDKSAGRQPGLGLSHARRLVLAHGGRIALENTPRGATATIRLPGWNSGGAPGARREDGGRIGGAAA